MILPKHAWPKTKIYSPADAVRRRILFLDFDGVLNNKRWFASQLRAGRTCTDFDPRNMGHLKRIVQRLPNLQIVVSSSWRCGRTVAELGQLLARVVSSEQIFDKTPELLSRSRGEEICQWRMEWGIREHIAPYNIRFAVLDDDGFDMVAVFDNFFRTDARYGLTRKIADAVVRHLRR
mgnify:CR=1 FL=1